MAETARARIIRARKEGLRHVLRGASHYGQVLENLRKMQDLADKDDVTTHEQNKFAMLASLVDKEWRIVERILPKQIKDEPDSESPEDTVSNVHNVIERLIGERVQRSSQAALPHGSVVPTPLRPEKGGSGDSGSKA